MTYTTNIPVQGDTLGGTRDRIRTNFQVIDTDFTVNHIAFNSIGAGKHKFVQTPDQVTDVASAVNEPVLYAKGTNNLGVIQYSRKGSNAVPSPITALQSPAAFITVAPGGDTTVLDFTGIPRAMGTLFVFDNVDSSQGVAYYIWWDGTTVRDSRISGSPSSITTNYPSPSVLQLHNGTGVSMNLYWTLDLKRTS